MQSSCGHIILALLSLMSEQAFGLFPNNRNMSEFAKFASDFVGAHSNHKVVLENLCWNRGDKLLFNKLLTAEASARSYSVPSNGPIKNYPHIVLASTACNFDSFWSEALASGLATYPNVWLVLDELALLDTEKYYVPINTLVITLKSGDTQSPKVLRTVYQVRANSRGAYRVQSLGKWSERSRTVHLERSLNTISSRMNFARSPLRVSYVITHKDSLNHLTDGRDIHLDSSTKINYALYDPICDILNATQVRLFADGWGFETGNQSTFSAGMFEDLVKDRSDVAGTVSFTPSSRGKYFKYVFAPLKEFAIGFVFRAPSLAYYTNLFVLPFAGTVWIALAGLLVLAVAVIKVIFTWEVRKDALAGEYEANEENAPTILDVFVIQMAILCQADFWPPPKSISGMMGLFTVLITFTFIYTAFSARIVLLLQSNTEQIDDFQKLYRANFEFGVDRQPFNVYYFKNPNARSNEYWRKLIYETKIRKPGGDRFLEAEDGMSSVQKSYFAFNTQVTVANYFIDKTYDNEEKCSVRMVDTIYKGDVPYLAIPRNSTYYEYLKVAFKRLAETGVHDREYKRYFARKPSCDGKGGTFVSVGLIEAYFPLLVYVSGVFLSVVLLSIEVLVHLYFHLSCTL